MSGAEAVREPGLRQLPQARRLRPLPHAWSASSASTVQLTGGGTVKADEAYIRESILQPAAKIVAGYQPVMPTFQGLVTEEGVVQLIEYIKSLGERPGAGAAGSGAVPAAPRSTPKNR